MANWTTELGGDKGQTGFIFAWTRIWLFCLENRSFFAVEDVWKGYEAPGGFRWVLGSKNIISDRVLSCQLSMATINRQKRMETDAIWSVNHSTQNSLDYVHVRR